MNCLECDTPSACYRYKCCGLSFCSVPCYKAHMCNVNLTMVVDVSDSGSSKTSNCPNKDGRNILLTQAQIESLREDKDLRSMLANDVLRRTLRGIASASDPVTALAPYMQDDFFSDFVTKVLTTLSAVVEPEADHHSN